MEAFSIENLTFTYANRDEAALRDVSISIGQGEFITLCGPSGSGKTTLLRQLKPSMAPHGTFSGQIFYEKKPLCELLARDAAAKIGFVMQSPDNQIVTDKVWHEMAFGLESLGYNSSEIRLRVAEMASFFGIQTWFHKSVTKLSGGQKQLLALASIMVLEPRTLILDEPTGQLDPIAAGEFLSTVGRINRELGVTVILTEHRLEEAFSISTRAVVMDRGMIIADASPRNVGVKLSYEAHGMFSAMPTPMRVWAGLKADFCNLRDNMVCPVSVRDGAVWLEKNIENTPAQTRCLIAQEEKELDDHNTNPTEIQLPSAVTLSEIWFRYEKNMPDVIKGLTFNARYGEISAILGGNGTGKSTALSLIVGLYKPYRGKVYSKERAFALPQNPQVLFTAKTVYKDLLEALSSQDEDEKKLRLVSIIALCRLEDLLNVHPYDLSGGEQQRAALAKVLLLQPKILLLDEPTKGLDADFKQVFADILKKLTAEGVCVIIASHDIEFCAQYADRCSLFFDGSIVTENTPKKFFAGNSFYTTAANRMARNVFPDAITVDDIIAACKGRFLQDKEPRGGQAGSSGNHKDEVSGEHIAMETTKKLHAHDARQYPQSNQSHSTIFKPNKPSQKKKNTIKSAATTERAGRKLSKRTITLVLIALITIPFTIFAGTYFFGDRRYYFISLLIILQTTLPFVITFERRKPQARELIILAVLCAIAVAGRTAFFMLPQFKPVVALVIITGVAFGGEAGFLVGAMTGFVSNFFFGQGPWTPYQMLALGIIGLLAGIIFKKKTISRTPAPLAAFGALATFFIYGGILNPAHIIISQSIITMPMLLSAYLQGLPMDLIHSAATVIFLLIISRPMLDKLDRVKNKYGLAPSSGS